MHQKRLLYSIGRLIDRGFWSRHLLHNAPFGSLAGRLPLGPLQNHFGLFRYLPAGKSLCCASQHFSVADVL